MFQLDPRSYFPELRTAPFRHFRCIDVVRERIGSPVSGFYLRIRNGTMIETGIDKRGDMQ